MAVSVADFRVRFPEFSDETDFPDSRISLFLGDATLLYMGSAEQVWCGKYDVAQAYLAAHLLTVGEGSAAGSSSAIAGPITSKSAGGVSVTRAVTAKTRSDNDDFLLSTIYGQQYINIRAQCFVGVAVANCL